MKYGATTSSPTGARVVAWNVPFTPVTVEYPRVETSSLRLGSVSPTVPPAFTPRRATT